MATRLIEICDKCKAEFPQSADIGHLQQKMITRFVLMNQLNTNTPFAIHTEICIHCQPEFIKKLKELFNHND